MGDGAFWLEDRSLSVSRNREQKPYNAALGKPIHDQQCDIMPSSNDSSKGRLHMICTLIAIVFK